MGVLIVVQIKPSNFVILKKLSFSNSWSDLLVNDSITHDDWEHSAFEMADVNHSESAEAGNSTCSMSSLVDKRSPRSQYFVRDARNLAESLFDLNHLSSPDCYLLSSPSDCLTDFGFEELYRGPDTFAAEMNQFEEICFQESNVQRVNSFTIADDQGM